MLWFIVENSIIYYHLSSVFSSSDDRSHLSSCINNKYLILLPLTCTSLVRMQLVAHLCYRSMLISTTKLRRSVDASGFELSESVFTQEHHRWPHPKDKRHVYCQMWSKERTNDVLGWFNPIRVAMNHLHKDVENKGAKRWNDVGVRWIMMWQGGEKDEKWFSWGEDGRQ